MNSLPETNFIFPDTRQSMEMIDLSKTRRCAIYARCSTLMQEGSIESQIQYNQAFARQNDLEIVKIYQDDGKTGRNDKRSGLQSLMKDLKSPERNWDLILVYRFDRLFRNSRLFMIYQYQFEDEQVFLLSAQESMLNNTHQMTAIFRYFVAQLAESESSRIGENVSRGKITSAQKGVWQGGLPPLGYDVVDGTLMINPQEKQVVQRIFKQRAEGLSMQKIADLLTEDGFTSKTGNPFKPSGIREILTNPCYKGDVQYNRSSSKGKNGFNRHKYKDDSQIVHVPTECEAIVSETLWNKVQPKSVNKGRSSKSTRYWLSGKVVCKQCGAVMHANRRCNHDKLYISFYCPNNKKHKTCDTKDLDMLKLNHLIIEKLCEVFFSKKYMSWFCQEFPRLNAEKRAELDKLKSEYKKIDRKIKNLMKVLESDRAEESAEQISKRLDQLSVNKKKIETDINKIEKSLCFALKPEELKKARGLFWDYCMDECNDERVASLFRACVDRVEVDNDNIHFVLKC